MRMSFFWRPFLILLILTTQAMSQTCIDGLEPKNTKPEVLFKCLQQFAEINSSISERLSIIEKGFVSPEISTRAFVKPFSNIVGGGQIPGSEGAAICSLARVDDDNPQGSCHVYLSSGRWMMKTGSDNGANACSAVCLFVQIAK